jgi:hypothetical protein
MSDIDVPQAFFYAFPGHSNQLASGDGSYELRFRRLAKKVVYERRDAEQLIAHLPEMVEEEVVAGDFETPERFIFGPHLQSVGNDLVFVPGLCQMVEKKAKRLLHVAQEKIK